MTSEVFYSQQPSSQTRVYFPNLNGLRFIAALLVIVHHIEQLKSMYGLPNVYSSSFIQIIGELGVVLFFVLSGFLITYLLLEEESRTGGIGIRNFYVRRILRIWPLYFLIILLALGVLPHIPLFTLPDYEKERVLSNLFAKVLLYIFFLPNLVSPLFGIVPYASLTWSIGTEEQFYLVWPHVLKFVKKHRAALMFIILFGYLLVARALFSDRTDFLPLKDALSAFWYTFSIASMAIGGFFAILLHTNSPALKFFLNKYLFYFALVFTSLMLYKGVYFPQVVIHGMKFPYLYKEFYSIWFGIIILNFAANRDILINLEIQPFNYLGKISYGLYMYHPIAITAALQTNLRLGPVSDALIYPLSLALTILFAGLSYRYFESFFLNLKTNFASVLSGNGSFVEGARRNQSFRSSPQTSQTARRE
ncbi:MAG TPA: acyltransferase [Anaerolineales bacterium]|nr:acyltransferase [Anaerolineales bacterium]